MWTIFATADRFAAAPDDIAPCPHPARSHRVVPPAARPRPSSWRPLPRSPVGWSVNHRITFAAVYLGDVRLWRTTQPPWGYDAEVARATAESVPSTFDFRPTLAALDVPVLVLQGDEDFLPLATWADALPGARRVVIEGAGHNAYTDAPEVVLGELRRFVAATAER